VGLTRHSLGVTLVLVGCGGDASQSSDEATSSATASDDAGADASSSDGGAGEGEVCAVGEPAPLRRLTATEYRNTVRDLLGIDASDLVADFPVDASVAGFANNAAVQTLQLGHARSYQAAAEAIANRLLADAERRDAVVGCVPASPGDDCVRAFVERLVHSAYRRPAETTDVEALVALAQSVEDPWGGVALVVRAVLQSPRFLFRVERPREPAPDDPNGAPLLDGHEIATRLSYLLWQSSPDAWLLERAADGSLADAEGVVAVAREALERAAVDDALAEFATGWLRLGALDDLGRDPARFPEWTPSLRAAMRDEAIALVRAGARDHGLLGAYTIASVWVTPELATIYGLPAPDGDGLVEVDVAGDPDRGGLLTTAAVLAVTTPTDVTSPVRRGVFVYDALLCSPLPPPPPGTAGELPPPDEVAKIDALEQHRSDPACAGCHDLLDPIGLGLERYDALGRVRMLDEGGHPVAEHGTVPGLPDGSFAGGVELGERLRAMPEAQRCVATQVFRWAMGRSETADDACVLDQLAAVVAETDGDYAELVAALVASDAFRRRPSP